jgi:hypothetical protein
MNWGWKITLVYSLFVVGILTLVFKARSEKVDLVATDYYAQELAYSKRIEAQRNASTMSERPVVRQDANQLLVELPASCEHLTNGNIHVYCPSNASLDQHLPLTNAAAQVFGLSELPTGIYLIKLSFEIDSKPYFIEQVLEWKLQAT